MKQKKKTKNNFLVLYYYFSLKTFKLKSKFYLIVQNYIFLFFFLLNEKNLSYQYNSIKLFS